jgi:hypothetical protein
VGKDDRENMFTNCIKSKLMQIIDAVDINC